jgi:hypothetical protein
MTISSLDSLGGDIDYMLVKSTLGVFLVLSRSQTES